MTKMAPLILSTTGTPFFDILHNHMSLEKEKQSARARTRGKREVPKGANVSPSRSGWIAIALVAATFIAMRFLGQASGERIEELSVTSFKRAVSENRVAKV